MPTTYILINSDLGSDMEIIQKIKDMLSKESSVKYEVQGVYGVYDIIIKISANSMDQLRSMITDKIRKIDKVYSTLTMMVIEEQEK
ncbi:MAG: Lrp/AsnC ligand binding domain-containing protein [Thaumarchaeota archaeon]|nr:Lrp/AsnC ligand binding domain-containing protein [Nitrososphaerota archaeon]MDE1866162.1 Lrp/AsnC ligand binding domain-containing protein [Nitrososphaerota archaeon]